MTFSGLLYILMAYKLMNIRTVMKKYHVYGIGNALVDMEVEVEDSFLQEMNVEKGLMTLVDQDRQNELLNHISGIKHKRSCGGSAANSMIAVAQLGGRPFYSCKVANDETGDFYFEDLVRSGASTNLHGDRKEGVTGKCMVFITPDAERTMNTYLGITETFSEEELRLEDLEDSQYLYIEGYLVTSETGRAAALKAKAHAEANGIKTALTFSDPSMAMYFKDGLKEMIGTGVDLLFCNEEEAMEFTETKTFEDAVAKLKTVAKSLAITRGADGAYLFDGEAEYSVPTRKVEPIDTNGAGDLFAGGFMYGITHGLNFEDSGRAACALSSQLVTQFGARLKDGQAKKIFEETIQG